MDNDDEFVFNFVGKNTFRILRQGWILTKALRADPDGKVILEVFDEDVKGQLWYKEHTFYVNEKRYSIIRNYDYDGVLTPNFDENVYEWKSKISLLVGAK